MPATLAAVLAPLAACHSTWLPTPQSGTLRATRPDGSRPENLVATLAPCWRHPAATAPSSRTAATWPKLLFQSLSRHQNEVVMTPSIHANAHSSTTGTLERNSDNFVLHPSTATHANHIRTNVSEPVASLEPQPQCLPCLENWQTSWASMKSAVSVLFW